MGACTGTQLAAITCEGATAPAATGCTVPAASTITGVADPVCGAGTDGSPLTTIADGSSCTFSCDSGTETVDGTAGTEAACTGTELAAITCEGARRLGGHTGEKTVTFVIVADETVIAAVSETMGAADFEAAFATAIDTAAGADITIGVVEGSLSSADAVAHVVTASSSSGTSGTSTANPDSGAVTIGSAVPLLGVCLAA